MSIKEVQKVDSEELVSEYLAAVNENDFETVEELLASDVEQRVSGERTTGPEAVVDSLRSFVESFPDYTATADVVTSDDDTVTVRFTASGTHSSEYEGVETTGEQVEWTGLAMYRVEDGEISEVFVEEDQLSVCETLEDASPTHAHYRV